ncbi:non-hydrolyzing UDP-N-acetylglucosamine 2-epimerase [Parahaliea aestuarii]|uniref:UDP-N-acetylglucosamine 2-epimerase (Non-hydrolyzing) n=1 Tax=Parahaliea aestuarii TaxID=1852021 RepID=A0A5C8ZMK1_9GAMM|nr:UDP-N-acetylglucosamine 2-epimerase (non-hydrolyzing) [Parahaliea aestuarii]TXS89415.1 UDP-N-acetylglucosamine 2-epimerase (non-hydrolyzing) [Parahaliea aestuarii]
MRVMTVLGTRPEIIRLSRIIPRLDECCDHTLVHTGQNFDTRLSDIFFNELGLRPPCHHLGVDASGFGGQIARIFERIEPLLVENQPDRVLILGDTNSALTAIIAKRHGIPVCHMEAGNRCYDDNVPEEVNRRVVDHSSDILLPYTERSRDNLLREGIAANRIFVTGNPIGEVIEYYKQQIDQSSMLDELALVQKGYFLVTLHRAENVDNPVRLRQLLSSLEKLAEEYRRPAVISVHPRLRARLESLGYEGSDSVRMMAPFSFLDFVHLEYNAFCLLSDSGTVQEECAILRVPSVTLRDVTERPETLESGSNIVTGIGEESVFRAVCLAIESDLNWPLPPEYARTNVSETVVKLITAYYQGLDRMQAI